MSQFLEPNSIGLNSAKLTHYICLCYFQNFGSFTKYCAHFELSRIETESERLMAVV